MRVHQIVFLVWGLSLTVATFAYWRATGPEPAPRSANASDVSIASWWPSPSKRKEAPE